VGLQKKHEMIMMHYTETMQAMFSFCISILYLVY